MNILIADSGSTKTEWVLMNREGKKEYLHTEGLNPYFLDREQIKQIIREGVRKELKGQEVDEIYFYGSGCGSEQRKQMLREAISESFDASALNIESDLLGAAIACFGRGKGVACIMGTGSNSCVYNEGEITDQIPSLGFILGDEGSGGYFGKKILNAYFYQTMPEELRKVMEKERDMKLDDILTSVYKKPQANRFVAAFSALLGEYSEHPYVRKLVREGFEEFADTQLAYFEGTEDLDHGFVGSIASIYQDLLEEVLAERSRNLSVVVQKPLERLAEYHLEILNQG